MNAKIFSTILAISVAAGLRAGAQIYDTNGDYVETFAGSGFSGYVDGVGQQTMFNFYSFTKESIVADTSGNLFVVDFGNYRIRKITPDGTVTTFAGNGNGYAPPGYGTNLSLVGYLGAMAIDHSNALWVVSQEGSLVRIGSDSYVSSNFLSGMSGISIPDGDCVDSSNNIYISDLQGNKIWRYKTNGVLEVFVGSGNQGSADGNGIFTSFYGPAALAADAADSIYVWDSGSSKIRRINQNRDVLTITGGTSAQADGRNPVFGSVSAMCVDSFGNLILACGSSVRKMSITTNSVTMAGAFTQSGYMNGEGDVALFSSASGVCVSQGEIFVLDADNERIRNITFNPQPQVVSGGNLGIGTYAGVSIIGVVGRTYQFQSSPDTSTWTTQATTILPSSPFLWIDTTPISGNKYYRALLLP